MKLPSAGLEAFYLVVQTRSFSEAAQRIHITQSALSQRVINLEAQLQTTLLIRTRGGIELTEAAQELLRYCQFQANFEDQFLAKLISKGPERLAGTIRVAGFSSVMRSLVWPAFRDLVQEHSKIRLHLQTRETYELLALLKQSQVDFILNSQDVDHGEIESILLGKERNVLISARKAGQREIYLDHDEKDQTTQKFMTSAKGTLVKFERHYLDDIYGILEGVKLGYGQAVVPEHLIRNDSDLKILKKGRFLESPVFLQFYKQPFYSALHQRVIDLLRTRVAQGLKLTR